MANIPDIKVVYDSMHSQADSAENVASYLFWTLSQSA